MPFILVACQVLQTMVEPYLRVFGYGLSGNGLVGLNARRHTLVMPRVDDCLAPLLGSYQRKQEEFAAEAGTYHLTPGWLEGRSHPLKEYHDLAAGNVL